MTLTLDPRKLIHAAFAVMLSLYLALWLALTPQASNPAFISKGINIGLANSGMSDTAIASTMTYANLGLGVAFSGGDVDQYFTNTNINNSATKNNYLNHGDIAKLKSDLAACDAKPGGCSDTDLELIKDHYRGISDIRDSLLADCKTKECIDGHLSQVASLDDFQNALGKYNSALGNGRGLLHNLGADQHALDTARYNTEQHRILQEDYEKFTAKTCGNLTSNECMLAYEGELSERNKQLWRGMWQAAGLAPGITGTAVGIADCIRDPSLQGCSVEVVAAASGFVGGAGKFFWRNAGKIGEATRGGVDDIPTGPDYTPTVIGDRNYSSHALEQMHDRGLTPSVVENTIDDAHLVGTGNQPSSLVYYDPDNGVQVVTNYNGDVVSARKQTKPTKPGELEPTWGQ